MIAVLLLIAGIAFVAVSRNERGADKTILAGLGIVLIFGALVALLT